MKKRSRSIIILGVLFAYILLQFLAWEIMFVRKTSDNSELKQRLAELTISDAGRLQNEIDALHSRKRRQVFMIVGEGTVFLLLLLFGVYKIRQSMQREEELALQQKNFFLSITHELKTPIAATKLQLQTLQKHELEKTQRQELLSMALEETERLDTLINNLLLANRLGSAEFRLNNQKQNISELTKALLQRYFHNEIAAGEIKAEIEPDVHIITDENIFPSIIMNLVDNALKYSFGNKNLTVLLKKQNSAAVLTVADEGSGIPDGEKTKVFEKFYRSGNEETRSTKGAGLGLFIVKDLVDKHKGAISLKDNQPRGTVFEIRFHAV